MGCVLAAGYMRRFQWLSYVINFAETKKKSWINLKLTEITVLSSFSVGLRDRMENLNMSENWLYRMSFFILPNLITLCLPITNLFSASNMLFDDGGRKPARQVKIRANTGRTCPPHTEDPWSQDFRRIRVPKEGFSQWPNSSVRKTKSLESQDWRSNSARH